MSYENVATSVSQALIIFLLDISGSMGRPMPGGKSRIQVVKEALKATATEMVQRSLKNREIRPRYRVAMLGYSDTVYDICGGIQPINSVAQMGLPDLKPLNRTNTADGFRTVKELLHQDLANWSPQEQKSYPAPLVIHMTDGEYSPGTGDPEPVVREIQSIAVPDGNVLVENVYISDDLKVSSQDVQAWPGYRPGDDLGSPYGNKLLCMSSPLPELYRRVMNDMAFPIQAGTAMMYPGIRPEFVQMAFAMGTATGTVEDAPRGKKWEDE